MGWWLRREGLGQLLLTAGTKYEQCSLYVPMEEAMLRSVFEEAAALASLALFLGMIAIWAQVIATL
jgi:hypothetical protein